MLVTVKKWRAECEPNGKRKQCVAGAGFFQREEHSWYLNKQQRNPTGLRRGSLCSWRAWCLLPPSTALVLALFPPPPPLPLVLALVLERCMPSLLLLFFPAWRLEEEESEERKVAWLVMDKRETRGVLLYLWQVCRRNKAWLVLVCASCVRVIYLMIKVVSKINKTVFRSFRSTDFSSKS